MAAATRDFLRRKVPQNWPRWRDLVTGNFRVVNPNGFLVLP